MLGFLYDFFFPLLFSVNSIHLLVLSMPVWSKSMRLMKMLISSSTRKYDQISVRCYFHQWNPFRISKSVRFFFFGIQGACMYLRPLNSKHFHFDKHFIFHRLRSTNLSFKWWTRQFDCLHSFQFHLLATNTLSSW